MTAAEFETRVNDWVRTRPDIEAVVQIGSRVQSGGTVDAWSDWDYQLMTRDPKVYQDHAWLGRIAPCWCAHHEKTGSGVVKLGAVFEGGLEADFVLLTAWQMKLVYWAMGNPGLKSLYPRALVRGIHDTRRVVGPGYRLLKGGGSWEARLTALRVAWPEQAALAAQDFAHATSAFWRHAVWLLKKTGRGELRAAARWYVRELFDHVYVLLAEETRLAGRGAGQQIRPGDIPARKAEQWLDAHRLRQTEITIAPDRRVLAKALLTAIDLFEEISASVARQRGFALADYSAVAAWLRAELAKLTV